MNVLILASSQAYKDMYLSRGWNVCEDMAKANLIQFTGGEDVDPSLYHQAVHPFTRCNPPRDVAEMDVFHEALELGIPMVGICRGGQFLNVMCGGWLYQDVDGHLGSHLAYDIDNGVDILVSSTHHQMMVPASHGEVLAVATESSKREYMKFGKVCCEVGGHDDVEAVYYEDASALCFQPHPEFADDCCRDYFFDLIDRHLNLQGD